MHICTNAASSSFVMTLPEYCHPCFVSNQSKLFRWSIKANIIFSISISKNLKSLRMGIEGVVLTTRKHYFPELSFAKMKTMLLLEIFLIFASICSAERIQVCILIFSNFDSNLAGDSLMFRPQKLLYHNLFAN